MTRSKVLLDFVNLSIGPKVLTYKYVIDCLTSNPLYTSPDVPISELTLILSNFEAAILAAADGNHIAKAALRNAEDLADTAYRNEAAYVQRVSNGDEAKILSSGFSVAKPHGPHHKAVLAAIDALNSGELKLVAQTVEKAGSYDWQMSEDDKIWVTIGQSTAASYFVTGLTPVKIYYFRYRAVTTQGVTDYCEPISKVVI